jgi:DNA-binding NarL/FixJ family response regulator
MKPPNSSRIRVAVADPSPVVLSGFARILETSDKIELVGSAATLQLLEQMLHKDPPQVTIIDWALLRGDMERTPYFIRDISNSTRVLISGMAGHLRDWKLAFEFGAKGVLSRRSSSDEVRKAIHKVATGGIWIKKRFADALLQATFTENSADGSVDNRIRSLTARERQVVECVCRGMKSKEVAASLQISENTVSHHLSSVFSKLNVKDRVGLVNFAYWNELHVSRSVPVKQFREPNSLGKTRSLVPQVPPVDRQLSS